MDKRDIVTLFDYNYWATARVLDAAGRITSEQYVAPARLSHSTIRATLVHTLAAETVWRLRCQGNSPASLLSEADLPTLDLLRSRWREEEHAMRAYLAELRDSDLKDTIHYQTTKGISYEQPLWTILAHVVNHGTQARAEAGIALLAFGNSPGDLDMSLYFREMKG
jgi:uncharacterized damage-inducible protein DinB